MQRNALQSIGIALLLFVCDSLLLSLPARHSSTAATRPSSAAAAPDVASYTFDVTLDADAKTLTGHQVVTYRNTTTDPIPDLVFHLYLNAFRSQDSLFMQESGASHRGHSWNPAPPAGSRSRPSASSTAHC